MSSVTASATAQTYAAHRPPVSDRMRIAAAIGNEVSSGTISASDATALNGALDAIDSGLKAGAGSSGDGAGTRLDPASAKDRIDALIADQVDNGKLTSDQAATLKGLFAEGGGKGAGGPPPGPPPGEDAGAAAGASRASSSAATPSSDDILATFIEQLKAVQTAGTGYAASGASGSVNASALLFDFRS